MLWVLPIIILVMIGMIIGTIIGHSYNTHMPVSIDNKSINSFGVNNRVNVTSSLGANNPVDASLNWWGSNSPIDYSPINTVNRVNVTSSLGANNPADSYFNYYSQSDHHSHTPSLTPYWPS
jgi:hypothetical protein